MPGAEAAALMLVCLFALPAAGQDPQEPAVQSARRTSAAARQNPAIRTFFRERFTHLYTRLEREENRLFIDRSIDSMIDQSTEKVLSLLDALHAERDRIQASMTPPLLDLLREWNRQRLSRAAVSPDLLLQLREMESALKQIENLARDLNSQLIYLRYALYVSLDYKLEKDEKAPPGTLLRQDLRAVIETETELEAAIEEFFFPQTSSVSIEGLKQESIPRLLEKIRKHADRAREALRGLL